MSEREYKRNPHCIVCRCVSKATGITLHRFPKDAELRAKWISSLGLENNKILNRSCVCEKHFTKDQYIRTRLKRNAVPTPSGAVAAQQKISSMTKTVIKENTSTTNDRVWWNGKIYLIGHCAFCLEPIPRTNTSEKDDLQAGASEINFSSMWPYLYHNQDGNGGAADMNPLFVRGVTKTGEWTSSSTPPVCSNSCQKSLRELHTQLAELEEIQRKLKEQMELVKNTSCKIRKSIKESHKQRRNHFYNILKQKNVPSNCVSTTDQFLNYLSGCTNVSNIQPKVPVFQNQIALISTSLNSSAIVDNQNNLFVLNPTTNLLLGGPEFCLPVATSSHVGALVTSSSAASCIIPPEVTQSKKSKAKVATKRFEDKDDKADGAIVFDTKNEPPDLEASCWEDEVPIENAASIVKEEEYHSDSSLFDPLA